MAGLLDYSNPRPGGLLSPDLQRERLRANAMLQFRSQIPEVPDPLVRIGRGASDVFDPMIGLYKYLFDRANHEAWAAERADGMKRYDRAVGGIWKADPWRAFGQLAATGGRAPLRGAIGLGAFEYGMKPAWQWLESSGVNPWIESALAGR